MSVFYAILGYGLNLGKTAYGINAIGNYLKDLFSSILNNLFNPFVAFFAVLWIFYQIYYFVTLKNNKIVRKFNLKNIFFNISLLCWIVYFLSGIWAFFFGSNTGGGLFNKTMEYGIDAMLNTLFWNLISFSIIPVLPISLIYMVIYVIKNKKD